MYAHTHTHTHTRVHTQEVPIIGILGKGDALEGFEAENAAAVSKSANNGFSASVQKPLDLQTVEALLGRLCTAGVQAGGGGGGSASEEKGQERRSPDKVFEKGESSELQRRDPTKREKRSLRILVVEVIPKPCALHSTPHTPHPKALSACCFVVLLMLVVWLRWARVVSLVVVR